MALDSAFRRLVAHPSSGPRHDLGYLTPLECRQLAAPGRLMPRRTGRLILVQVRSRTKGLWPSARIVLACSVCAVRGAAKTWPLTADGTKSEVLR
jgi:hypothetical protein